jgi:hypothetical protein
MLEATNGFFAILSSAGRMSILDDPDKTASPHKIEETSYTGSSIARYRETAFNPPSPSADAATGIPRYTLLERVDIIALKA